MRQRFETENVGFDYDLILQSRKTIAVTVHPDLEVTLKAPEKATQAKINDFLRRKTRWVLKQQRYFDEFKKATHKNYVSGETFRYLGRNYKLLVSQTESDDHVSLQFGSINVFSSFSKNRLYTKKLLDAWYEQNAKAKFEEQLKQCAKTYDIEDVPDLKIRQMKSRWGSYSKSTHSISLNHRLIQASRKQIDYVITHELCHIEHMNHSPAFYALLGKRLPNWKKVKAALESELIN
jgi:predicted metal-dependent hydrolase